MNNSIKAYRTLLKISQKSMAEKLGICITSYNHKEQGKKDFTHKEMCELLCIFRKHIPELTSDELFFTKEVIKMKTKFV
ncbi:helix-turn-helix transcriptional regulator [Clostridium perfringens]|uniref:helix-turn-helix transcriptional regulator n=1 Tax=Clostridium perfringens TaxID=1502 RepID=UPI0024BC9DFA|nr:helix-turn-helix transcriptional regulator [Clostridium perfringens]